MERMERKGSPKRVSANSGRACLGLALLNEGLLAIEVYGPQVDAEAAPVVTFPCEMVDLRRVLDNAGTYRAVTPEGHLLIRPSADSIWFVYGVNDPALEDSCLLPRADLELALVQVLAARRASLY
jgi:hypothetical protein